MQLRRMLAKTVTRIMAACQTAVVERASCSTLLTLYSRRSAAHLYVYSPLFESEVGNIGTKVEYQSPIELAWMCNSNQLCQGFNTDSWLKENIKPLIQWKASDFGLYIKTHQTFTVKGVELTDEEVRWMKWIAKCC